MAWAAENDSITTMARDRMLSSSALFLASFPTARCHFPSFDVKASGALPAAVFQRVFYRAERHAPGEYYGKFRVIVVLYVATTTTIGVLEKLADDICNEVADWTEEGLAVTNCEAGMATDPSDAQKAAANDSSKGVKYRTITITMDGEG